MCTSVILLQERTTARDEKVCVDSNRVFINNGYRFLTMNTLALNFCRVGARPVGENLKAFLKSSQAKDRLISIASLRRGYFGSCCMVSLVVMICLQSMRFFC